MGRPRKCKLSDDELRKLLLKLYVDADGNKVSNRKLLQNYELIEAGWFMIKGGNKVPVSTGVLHHWNKLLGIDERAIYGFHADKIDKTFDEWSKRYNRGHKRKPNDALTDDKIKSLMMEHFDIAYSSKPLHELEKRTIKRLDMLGKNGKKEMEEFWYGIQEKA